MNSSIVPVLVGGVGEINFGKQFRQGNRIYDANSIAMALLSQPVGNAGGNSYLYMIIDDTQGFDGGRCDPDYAPSVRANRSGLKTRENNLRIRKLTQKECYRLMGFDDIDHDRAAAVVSNSQLYKQAGNSIVVPVLEGVLKNAGRYL